MNSVLNKFVSILILTAIFFLNSTFAFSAEITAEENLQKIKEEIEPQLKTGSMTSCVIKLTPLFDAETLAFFEFLDNNFKNKSSTSSLLNIAVARYIQYKRNLYGYYSQMSPGNQRSANTDTTDELFAYSKCGELTETYVFLAKQRMIFHIRNNVAQKKTTVLLEKYQAINDKLRDMNLKMAKMYGYFLAFKSRLPGFLKECVTN